MLLNINNAVLTFYIINCQIHYMPNCETHSLISEKIQKIERKCVSVMIESIEVNKLSLVM